MYWFSSTVHILAPGICYRVLFLVPAGLRFQASSSNALPDNLTEGLWHRLKGLVCEFHATEYVSSTRSFDSFGNPLVAAAA